MYEFNFKDLKTRVTSDSITLDWEIESNIPEDKLYYEAVLFGEKEERFEISSPVKGAKFFTFTELKPETEYDLFVRAYKEPGVFLIEYPKGGKRVTTPSEELTKFDPSLDEVDLLDDELEPEPVKIPQFSKTLQVSDITSSSFKVKWEKIADKDVRYQVFLKRTDATDNIWKIIRSITNAGSATVKGLESDVQYDFYVKATTPDGSAFTYDKNHVKTKSTPAVAQKAPSLLLRVSMAKEVAGDHYADLPDIVRPFGDEGRWRILNNEIGLYLFKTDGKTKEGFCVDRKNIQIMVSDGSVLAVRFGTMYVSVDNGPIANATAILIRMLGNGTSSVRIRITDPDHPGLVLDKTFTVEVKNPTWEKSSTLKVSTVRGYFLGFNWEKMEDKTVRYDAYLKEAKDKEWKQVAAGCKEMSGIGCGGLKADTSYDFYYEVTDEKGKVLRHEACSARTSDKVLKVSHVTSDGFTIVWDPLDLAKHKETDYGVYLGGEGPGTAWCKRYKGIDTYTYTGLKPGVGYSTLVYVYGPDGKDEFTYEAAERVTIPFPEDAMTLVSKKETVLCNGIYGEGAVGLDIDLGSRFNRKFFEIDFDYLVLASDKDSDSNDNIITIDSSHRALGLKMKDGFLFVTTNNGDNEYDADIRIRKGTWQHVNINLIDGNVAINGKLIKVGDLEWSASDNVLSSRNFSNGSAFKGQIRNLTVKTKSSQININRIDFSIEQGAEPLRGTNSIRMLIQYTFFNTSTGKTEQGEWKYDWSNKSGTTSSIQLPANCYFKDNRVEVILQSRITTVSSWYTNSRGMIDITKKNLKFKLGGHYLKKTVCLEGSPSDGYSRFI